MARRCSGGIILGYSQFEAESGVFKPGTDTARTEQRVRFPTPWNQLEAGILFGMKLPLMVFREDGISGGVFDNGVTDVFINKLPTGDIGQDETSQLIAAIQIWVARVRNHYREWT